MTQKKTENKLQKMTSSLSKTRNGRILLFALAILLVVVILGYGWWKLSQNGKDAKVLSFPDVSESDISIHFLELGNKYAGDCTYIKTETCDILIDCGSKLNSLPTITNYLNHYVEDGVFEYVIVTHAHQDHIAGFSASKFENSFFGKYDVEVVIDSDTEATTQVYSYYTANIEHAVSQGTTHYNALQCVMGSMEFEIGGGYTMTVLDSPYYSNPAPYQDENNNSVCLLISNGEKNYLFTGDLEATGEVQLLSRNTLPRVDLFKAPHHGSNTASSEELLSVIRPKTVVVSCCAGSPEYTSNKANQFPAQVFVDNVAPYTDEIYVTSLYVKNGKTFKSLNGNIVYMSSGSDYVVACSASNVKLKNSEWFKKNRTWPL